VKKGYGRCGGSKPYAVVKDDDGSVEGCHETRAKAQAQVRALYASENSFREFTDLIEHVHREMSSADLENYYGHAFARAGGTAAQRFRAQTITAAAWVAPSNSELASSLTERERERIEKELQDAQDELTAILLLPLGVVAATGLAAVLARRGEEVFAERVLYDIQRIVKQGIEEKWTVIEVSSRLRSEFTDLAPDIAQTIARTQITALVNESSLRAAKAVDPAIYKTWVTAGDNRVRIAHAQAAGQTKPLNSAFQVGGSSLQYPGDPAGPLDMVANCRCVLTYTKSLPLTASAGKIGGEMVQVTLSTPVSKKLDTKDLAILGSFVQRAAHERLWTERRFGMALTADASGEGPGWRAILGAENSVTPDGRMIAEGALESRDFPLPFMALFETGPGGHEGAKLAGRIDGIEMDGHNFVGSGVVDLGEAGQELIRLRQAGMPLGVSFDLAVDEMELRRKDDPMGEAIPEEEEMEAFLNGDAIMVFTKGTILGATAAPMQAIDEANEIEILVEDGEGKPAVIRAHAALEIADIHVPWTFTTGTAPSGVIRKITRQGVEVEYEPWQAGTIRDSVMYDVPLLASAAFPVHPPLAWFEDPKLTEPTPITYTEDGRVFGHLAPWEGCHYGYSTCVPPPCSSYNYAYFRTGELKTAEGELIPVGKIMFCRDGGKHVDADPRMSAREAAEHYDDTTKLGAYVSAGEDEWGIWLAGAVKPGLSDEELQHLRANLPSGDWRPVGMSSELIAAFSVPVGGFAVPRADLYLAASAKGPDRMQALIIRPGMVEDAEELSEGEVARAIRVLAARAHGPEALAELARS
jgi:hypothetical protein